MREHAVRGRANARILRVWSVAFAGLVVTACRSDDLLYIGTQTTQVDAACKRTPTVPAPELGLDPFYEKSLDARGIPVIGSASVDDRALVQACITVMHLLPRASEVLSAMVQHEFRVAVLSPSEVLTELPEYRDLYAVFPGDDWDAMRGVGATRARPVSSVGQENVLCSSNNESPGEFILPQTFSHGLRTLGIEVTDADFSSRLEAVYEQALAAGRWKGTFASSSPGQYFAEGIQDWFDANAQASPADGVHNEVNTRDELKAYDPALAGLIAEYLVDEDWRTRCP